MLNAPRFLGDRTTPKLALYIDPCTTTLSEQMLSKVKHTIDISPKHQLSEKRRVIAELYQSRPKSDCAVPALDWPGRAEISREL